MTAIHIDDDLLTGYSRLAVTPATAAAIEAHLTLCPLCRAGLEIGRAHV